ncbi:MAG TPA: hypothetical protein VN858_03510 [Casimicrobiaceae bacterium]|jgi:hypothetical protein|nr:hypothetical protein [Casimicrobiaceae bacterium]
MRATYAREWTAASDSPEERLLDDAIDDTFPASDPVALNQPGSVVYARYAAREREARRSRRRLADRTAALLLIGAAVAATLLVVRRKRPRDELQ